MKSIRGDINMECMVFKSDVALMVIHNVADGIPENMIENIYLKILDRRMLSTQGILIRNVKKWKA